MSAVDYDGRRPRLHRPPRRAEPQPKGQNGLAVGRQFMEAVKQLDGRGGGRGRQMTEAGDATTDEVRRE